MIFRTTIPLKNEKSCTVCSAEPQDAEAFVHYSLQLRGETDYLCAGPEEAEHDPQKEALRLEAAKSSQTDVTLCAFVDGELVGSASVNLLRNRRKMLHRAGFGIGVLAAYQGLGIGNALTEQCILCAKQAGFVQLELEVVAENEKGIAAIPAARLYCVRQKSPGLPLRGWPMAGAGADAAGIGECLILSALTELRKLCYD